MVYGDSENISVGSQGRFLEEVGFLLDFEEGVEFGQEVRIGQNVFYSNRGVDVEVEVGFRYFGN